MTKTYYKSNWKHLRMIKNKTKLNTIYRRFFHYKYKNKTHFTINCFQNRAEQRNYRLL